MSRLRFPEKLINDGSSIKSDLSLISFTEEGTHIIYSPALDLSGYGNSEDAAKESFQVVLKEFLSYCINKDTLYDELEKLGWKINRNKQHPSIKSPELSSLLERNPDLENILREKEYHKYNQTIDLPVCA